MASVAASQTANSTPSGLLEREKIAFAKVIHGLPTAGAPGSAKNRIHSATTTRTLLSRPSGKPTQADKIIAAHRYVNHRKVIPEREYQSPEPADDVADLWTAGRFNYHAQSAGSGKTVPLQGVRYTTGQEPKSFQREYANAERFGVVLHHAVGPSADLVTRKPRIASAPVAGRGILRSAGAVVLGENNAARNVTFQ